MLQQEIQLLTDIYNRYLETNDRECYFSFADITSIEKKNMYNSLDYLKECEYIQYTAQALGFCQFKITIKGIKFVQNGFKEPEPLPAIKGDNNIFVTGTNNTVSGNYNQISVDISQSDLPDDYKELINTFLYEIKNPTLNPDKKFSKIKSFLADISSGTISGIASTGLTTLISSLLSQISF